MIFHLSTNYVAVSNKIKHGGVERVIYQLSQEQQKNEQVVIYGMPLPEGTLLKKNIKYKAIYPDNIQLIKKNNIEFYNLFMKEQNKYIFEQIYKKNPDIVHDHFGYFTASEYGERLLKKGYKLNVSIYGLIDNPYYINIYEKIKKINKKFPSNLKLFSTSKSHLVYLRKHGIYCDDYMYNIASPFEKDIKFSMENNFMLSLGVMRPEKGHKLAIEFCKKHGLKLLLVGAFPSDCPLEFRKYIKRNTSEINLDNEENEQNCINKIDECFTKENLIYIKEISEDIKRVLFNKAKAFLFFPEWEEPFAVTVLESLSAGTPIIHNSCQSVIEGVTNDLGIDYRGDWQYFLTNVNKEKIITHSKKYAPDTIAREYMKKYLYL